MPHLPNCGVASGNCSINMNQVGVDLGSNPDNCQFS